MLMGPASTPGAARRVRRSASSDNPRNYIAQPVIPLSRHLCYLDGELESRHIDLRPFVIHGEEIHVVPGGLTRVALTQGLAGRELVAGRREQGHLGAGRC